MKAADTNTDGRELILNAKMSGNVKNDEKVVIFVGAICYSLVFLILLYL